MPILTQRRQRAINADPYLRQNRLAAFLQPIRESWQDDQFRQNSSTFPGFCNMLGLENVGPYMQSKEAQKLADWSEVVLDAEGRLVQEEMTRKFQVRKAKPHFCGRTNLTHYILAVAIAWH